MPLPLYNSLMDLKTLEGIKFLDSSFPLPLDRPFTKQATAEGITPNQLTWLVQNGYLRRPIKGVLLATQAGDSTDCDVRLCPWSYRRIVSCATGTRDGCSAPRWSLRPMNTWNCDRSPCSTGRAWTAPQRPR